MGPVEWMGAAVPGRVRASRAVPRSFQAQLRPSGALPSTRALPMTSGASPLGNAASFLLLSCGSSLPEPIMFCCKEKRLWESMGKVQALKTSAGPQVRETLQSRELSPPAQPPVRERAVLQGQVVPCVLGSGRIQSGEHLLSPMPSCRRCTSSTTTPTLRTRTWHRSG